MKPQFISLLMGGITLLAVPASATDETINCTATPNCADLGYTKNADSCPDGGIKCPFDENKMFCLRSADLGFQIKNDVKAGDYLYTDGTSSATYTKGKGMVGIVLRPHPGNPRHALVMTLTTPYMTPIVARSYCSDGLGNGIYGTGLYLANIGELISYSKLSSSIRNRIMNDTKQEYCSPFSCAFNCAYQKDQNKFYYYHEGSLSSAANSSTYGTVCVIYL